MIKSSFWELFFESFLFCIFVDTATITSFVFMSKNIKNELFNVLSGKSEVSNGSTIQTVARYLKDGEGTSVNFEGEKQFKKQETKRLERFVSQENLWIDTIDFSQYVSEGAEQRVYLKDGEHVLKLNDAIYYASWVDYCYNLLLHNYFFPDTAYTLNGFTKDNDSLYAVVQQNFVSITAPTNLEKVKQFMSANGFENNRNNDYINTDLGIILEDLHDENVLNRNDVLYFIDTVFYLTPDFWTSSNNA